MLGQGPGLALGLGLALALGLGLGLAPERVLGLAPGLVLVLGLVLGLGPHRPPLSHPASSLKPPELRFLFFSFFPPHKYSRWIVWIVPIPFLR